MSCVEVQADNDFVAVVRSERISHEGDTRRAFKEFLSRLNRYEFDRVAVTGRAFREKVPLTAISEPVAVERAIAAEFEPGHFPQLLVSLGGETQLVYRVGPSGGIISVHTGSKCASGTGEFFLQQIRRMGLELDEAVSMAREGTPHRIAGRCSVFCKSDCTHALNKGEGAGNIAAGLCHMMADKVGELVKDMPCDTLGLIGGGSLNTAVINLLRDRYPSVVVPAHAPVFEAWGAALWALDNDCRPLDARRCGSGTAHSFGTHPPLGKHR